MSEIKRDDISFAMDGIEVVAAPYETIWQVATRIGRTIPHLCHCPTPGYRADGNCRSCLVEIEGEGLEPSCRWRPQPGMKVLTDSARARRARSLVMELLLADQPPRSESPDPQAAIWHWAERIGVDGSRFPRRASIAVDRSHAAIAVTHDACIQCSLCLRACNEVQGHDVIGMVGRGAHAHIGFDFDDRMRASSCVACGECVQACPTGALVPARVLDAPRTGQAIRAVDSLCPYCGVGCRMRYHVRDDDILYVTGIDGPANQQRLCVKGRFGFDYVRHPHRLTTPLIRRPEATKTADLYVDPADPYTHFRAASWDEALAVAAEGFRRVLAQYGHDALAGFGSAKCTNEEAYLFQKFVRTAFGNNNVDHCTRLCHAASVTALLEGLGSGAVTAPFTAALDADVILVIGANPVENHPVAATYLRNAARYGATLIVIDPRHNPLARDAAHALQFRPGSDVALLNALLYTIIDEQLHDRRYVEAHTEDFEVLRAHIRDYSPEEMAPVCGIDAALLRTVARKYATAHRSIIFWGMGISQSVHGTDNVRALIALALLTGHVGRPGTGLHPLRGQNNVQGASDCGLIPMVLPDYQSVENPTARMRFEQLWGTALNPTRGLTVVEIIDAVYEDRIKGLYFMGENPAMSDPDVQHVRAALARAEHLVVQEIFLTETAAFADVILPAAAWPEKDGTATNTNRQIQIGRKAVEPPGQARADWWIVQELARRMGLAWNYSGPRDVYEEMRGCMASIGNISWERLLRDGTVTYPCSGDQDPGQAIVFGDGFPTESGRARFVPAALMPNNEPPDAQYPFVLTTGRSLEHWHTGAMSRRSRVLDELEPEAVAMLCAADMARLGLAAGDYARISTRRGHIEVRIRADDAVPAGMVFIPFCWSEAPANRLTSAELDPAAKIPGSKYCAAQVERIGRELENTAAAARDEATTD